MAEHLEHSGCPLVDIDGEPSEHPAAFAVLYELYRAMGCAEETGVAVDSADVDDCMGVADASVRALMAAGLLRPAEVDRSHVRVDPAQRFGQPDVRGARLPEVALAAYADACEGVLPLLARYLRAQLDNAQHAPAEHREDET